MLSNSDILYSQPHLLYRRCCNGNHLFLGLLIISIRIMIMRIIAILNIRHTMISTSHTVLSQIKKKKQHEIVYIKIAIRRTLMYYSPHARHCSKSFTILAHLLFTRT